LSSSRTATVRASGARAGRSSSRCCRGCVRAGRPAAASAPRPRRSRRRGEP